jgi:7-keto-8-aminopelargonate synthetase-like enzyme
MVAQGKARIRTIMNAALTQQDLDHAINAISKVGRDLKII